MSENQTPIEFQELTVNCSNNAYDFGKGQATEQRMKGTMVLLGPMVNIMRVPTDGRSFESLGEDTYLAATFGPAIIKGIQVRNASGEQLIS
jgi:beta-glucosidase